jgi:hypothetical protein
MILKGIGWLAGRRVLHITGSTAARAAIALIAKKQILDKLPQYDWCKRSSRSPACRCLLSIVHLRAD